MTTRHSPGPSLTMPALNVAVPPLPSVSKQSLSLNRSTRTLIPAACRRRPVAASAVLECRGAVRGGCAARVEALEGLRRACAGYKSHGVSQDHG